MLLALQTVHRSPVLFSLDLHSHPTVRLSHKTLSRLIRCLFQQFSKAVCIARFQKDENFFLRNRLLRSCGIFCPRHGVIRVRRIFLCFYSSAFLYQIFGKVRTAPFVIDKVLFQIVGRSERRWSYVIIKQTSSPADNACTVPSASRSSLGPAVWPLFFASCI